MTIVPLGGRKSLVNIRSCRAMEHDSVEVLIFRPKYPDLNFKRQVIFANLEYFEENIYL